VSAEGSARRVTFGDVLANPEFRAMYVAQALSVVGDQLARIAVAVLVFNRSHSALLTALSFGVSYLPWVVGGPLLAGYADRLRRRNVMIFCDLVRAVLVLGLAIRGTPIAILLILVTLITLMEPPFSASRASMLPDVVGEGEQYAIASTLSNTTNILGVALGFAVGGIVVTSIGIRPTILIDSASFLLSAGLLRLFVTSRPALHVERRDVLNDLNQGIKVVFHDAYLRWLVIVSWLTVGAAIAPESIAVPYAAAHGGGPTAAGLLTAALPIGSVIGALIVGRWIHPNVAPRFMLPMALTMPAVLALTAFDPPVVVTWLLWFVAGALSAMQLIANRVFVATVPREVRGRAFGIAAAGIATAQGVGAVICGAVAQHLSPAIGVADVALPVFAAVCVISVRTFRSSAEQIPTRNDVEGIPDEEATTSPQAQLPARRPEPRIWALSGVVALVAGFVMSFLGDNPVNSIGLPAWWLFLLFLIAIAAPMRFVFRRQPWSLHLEAVPLVLGFFFFGPLTLIGVRVAAAAVANSVVRRQPIIRQAFNLGLVALSTACGIIVFRALVGLGDGLHVGSWPGSFTAVVTDDVASGLLVIIVASTADRAFDAREAVRPLAVSVGVNLVNTFLGLVTASALSYDVNTVWAITVFVVLSITAFRMYHRLADRHAALDKLYAVARELGPIAAEPSDLAPALTQLRRIIRAESLELAMLGDDPEFATVVTVFERHDGEGIEVTERELDPISRSVLTTSSTSVLRPARRLVTQRNRRDDDRMAVPVIAQDRPLALLTAHNRSGEIGSFDQSDFRLLEAAADQLSAALEKGRLVESLRRAATRDSLTNLANLDSLRAFLTTMLDGSSGGVLLLLDIDRFHEINDTLGHDAGDAILIEVARRLESAPTHGALVARVGGDQFALAIPGHAGGEVARLAALAVKSRVDGPLRFDNVSADLRITIGMSRAPEHGTDTATLLRRAEMAMTDAKGSSSGIAEWEPALERDGSRRLNILAGLRQALANNDLRVEFQPKIKLGSGDVAGFEALVRWRHPDLGAVSPAEFVPLAEASGLISALTSNVLRLSLDGLRRWHDSGRFIGVAVNISARSLDDPVLVGQVAAMLTASGVEPRWLTLEITESSVMENPARSLDVLLQLRSLGVRLSIDDFGTGYSSLHQLRGLPVHEVKIDKAFVDHVDGDGADRAVVRAVVELCASLGLTTVAEGVEQASQAYALESLGVSQVQGYFYGRPMTEAAATEWLLPRVRAGEAPPHSA
jgi:diguanylate cyclase (GGDEF)-like protein